MDATKIFHSLSFYSFFSDKNKRCTRLHSSFLFPKEKENINAKQKKSQLNFHLEKTTKILRKKLEIRQNEWHVTFVEHQIQLKTACSTLQKMKQKYYEFPFSLSLSLSHFFTSLFLFGRNVYEHKRSQMNKAEVMKNVEFCFFAPFWFWISFPFPSLFFRFVSTFFFSFYKTHTHHQCYVQLDSSASKWD